MTDLVLETRNLRIGYSRPQVVIADKLNLALRQRELVCLIGPNGAGKSTLLRTLSGMQSPLGGTIHINARDMITLSRREIAQQLSIVLTDRVDVGLLSGYGLVALGRHPHTDWTGALSAQDEAVIQWAVEVVSAESLAPRSVNTLSDGERQKLMIARALAQEPAIIILDEPTAYLDLPRRVEIMQLLRQLARETKRAILLSTHDLDLALRHADRLWLMPYDRPLLAGAPEDLVLSGAIGDAFASDGVVFDQVTGSFKPIVAAHVPIRVVGEGLRRVWLLRALEREGFRVVDDAHIAVTIHAQHFHIQSAKTESNVDDIGDVLHTLKRIIS